MIISGEQIAEEIRHEIAQEMSRMNIPLTLLIVQVGEHPASAQYIRKKMAFANSLGINATLRQFPSLISETALVRELHDIIRDIDEDRYAFTGVIVQLPLSKQIDAEKVLAELPPEYDVDLLSSEATRKFTAGTSRVLPPVVGAVAEIFGRVQVDVKGKKAVVVGQGKLVGKPVAIWLEREGATVTRADRTTRDLKIYTQEADIIVTGVGSAKLITPGMIKPGVILIDAGTSESEGRASGDADPECALKCSIFTPVPGGVGPITVAMLFKNLIELAKSQSAF